jgi:hypothetical protein
MILNVRNNKAIILPRIERFSSRPCGLKLHYIRSWLYLRHQGQVRNALCWVEWIQLISKPALEISNYFLLLNTRNQVCSF